MIILWIALFIGFIWIPFLSIQTEIKLIVKEGKNYSFIAIRILRGLIRLRFNLSIRKGEKRPFWLVLRKTDSALDKKTSPEEVFQLIQRSLRMFKKYRKSILYMQSKTNVNNFSVYSKVGVEDAAATALITGGFFLIFSMCVQYLENRHHLKGQKLVVVPVFQGYHFELDMDCIITLKFGYIIITGIKMAIQMIKGGEQSGRTSD